VVVCGSCMRLLGCACFLRPQSIWFCVAALFADFCACLMYLSDVFAFEPERDLNPQPSGWLDLLKVNISFISITTASNTLLDFSACSASVDRDDLVKNKCSDKRGWSLRKKTASQWVLSNSIITELPPSSENKISEPAIINSEAPTTSSISEKTSANLWTEILPRV
nr:protein IQ-DOMAIN 32-like [Tanacetum cinerariifolium]